MSQTGWPIINVQGITKAESLKMCYCVVKQPQTG